VVGGFAILFAYGWKTLAKYLLGSIAFGLSVLFILLMLRGEGNPLIILESYLYHASGMTDLKEELLASNFITHSLIMIKAYWFGIVLSIISTIYLFKSYLMDKKIVSINRFYFWLALALVPILEPMTKLGFDYHFANCIPGLVGISAMCWKYFALNESKIVKNYSLVAIILLCISGVYGNTVKTLSINVYQKENALKDAYGQLWESNYNEIETIKLSNYLIAADMIKKLSNEDSTLAVAGFAAALYPLTGLAPTSFKTMDLRRTYLNLNWNEDEFVALIKREKPTIIFPTRQQLPGINILSRAIQRTNLYERVAIVSYSPDVYYKSINGDIYRLKSFRGHSD
jgi:hypothetical protein